MFKLYSVQNKIIGNKCYKVVCIFGIKFSFRNKRREKIIQTELEKQFIKNSLNDLINQNNELKINLNNLKRKNVDLNNEIQCIKNNNSTLRFVEEVQLSAGISENNKLLLIGVNGVAQELNPSHYENFNIKISGNNNIIKIYEPIQKIKNCLFEIGNDNSYIEIGKNCSLNNVHIRACFGKNQYFKIGDNTKINSLRVVLDEESKVEIGNNCLFAVDCIIRASDGHSLIDKNTGIAYNKPTPIQIGNHCWFGLRTIILKGTKIPNNTISGAGSLLSGIYEDEYTILAGNPAKVIKRNVTWDHRSPYYYIDEEV